MKLKYIILFFLFLSNFLALLFNINIFEYLFLWFSLFILFYLFSMIRIFFHGGIFSISKLIFLIIYFALILLEPLISVIVNGELSYESKFGKLEQTSFFLNNISHIIFIFIFFLLNEKNKQIKFRKTDVITHSFNYKMLFKLFVIFIIGLYPYIKDGFANFIVILISGRGFSNSQFITTGSASETYINHLSSFLIVVSSFSAYYLLTHLSMNFIKKFSLIFLFIASLLVVASSGTRTRVLLIVLPMICLIVYLHMKNLRYFKKSDGLLIFLFAIIVSIMGEFRKVGYNQIFVENRDPTYSSYADGLDLNNEFLYVIENFPKPVNDRTLIESILFPIPEQFIKFITNPIPRAIYSNKYIDPSFEIYNKLRIGYSGLNETFNITPTIFGRFYMLYGIIGIIYLSFFIAYAVKKTNYFVNSKNDIETVFLSFIFLAFLCQSLRDLSPGWIYPFVFSYFTHKFMKLD